MAAGEKSSKPEGHILIEGKILTNKKILNNYLKNGVTRQERETIREYFRS